MFLFLIILLHFFLRLVLMLLLVVFLSIYQSYTIQPIDSATIIIIYQPKISNCFIPSTSPAVGSNEYYCKAHSSNWPSPSGPVNVWFGFFSLIHWIILMLVGAVIVAAHAPSPKDTPAMTIPMIKSSFGFVIVVVSYLLFHSLLC